MAGGLMRAIFDGEVAVEGDAAAAGAEENGAGTTMSSGSGNCSTRGANEEGGVLDGVETACAWLMAVERGEGGETAPAEEGAAETRVLGDWLLVSRVRCGGVLRLLLGRALEGDAVGGSDNAAS